MPGILFGLFISAWGLAHADLVSRLGGHAFFDADINVTWLAEASNVPMNWFHGERLG